jgi:hypothetical protein
LRIYSSPADIANAMLAAVFCRFAKNKIMYKAQGTFFLQKRIEPVGDVKPGMLAEKMKCVFRQLKEEIELGKGTKVSMYMDSEFSGESLGAIGLLEHEGVVIEIIKESENIDAALSEGGAILETICDGMAFRMQKPVFINQLRVFETNDNGEQINEGSLFPFPHGYQPEKFLSAVSFGGIGEAHPSLKEVRFDLNSEITAALRWYHKSLAASFEIDKFVFLFIACEVLCKLNQVKIKQFYKNQCGHNIENCPTCGVTTERVVNGASIKSFLEDECGVKPEVSKMIWSYRQILHGSNEGFKGGLNMAQIRVELQHAITQSLKGYLAIDENALPKIDAGAPIIANVGFTYK